MTGLDTTAKSVLFYRSELQWIGGMGIIVLAVAVLPLLGVGGMQLFRAETPGPFKDEKLTPRIAHSAQNFWVIYIGLTVACTIGYVLSGMSLFDAVTHSFSTLSTGGFSTHDASMAYFNSLPIEIITEIFMFLGALNFSIHFLVFRRLNISYYFTNPEVLAFTLIVAASILIAALVLFFQHTYPSFFTSLRHSAFTVISVITSTGYTTQNFAAWPTMLPAFLMFISFIGGCSGSTAGGMKVIRVVLLFNGSPGQNRRPPDSVGHDHGHLGLFCLVCGGLCAGDVIADAGRYGPGNGLFRGHDLYQQHGPGPGQGCSQFSGY